MSDHLVFYDEAKRSDTVERAWMHEIREFTRVDDEVYSSPHDDEGNILCGHERKT